MDSRAVDLENLTPELKQVSASASSTPWTYRRLFYRSMTTSVAVFSPLFAIFVYRSIARVRDLSLAELGEDKKPDWFVVFLLWALVIYFTVTYFLGDPPVLNPVEESENLLQANALEEKEMNQSGRLFANANKIFSLPTLLHFGADSGIAIAALTSNTRPIYLGLGIPLTLFSVMHQYATNKRDIEVHSYRFVQVLSQFFTEHSIFSQILKEPLRSLEVMVEVFSYVSYYGISAGYIANQLAIVFSEDETNTYIVPWIISITLLTAYITAFSKTLIPYSEFFNPAFSELREEDLRDIRLPWTTHLLNGGIALIRAITLGWLSCRLGPQDAGLKALLSASICTFAFAHPFYVLYQKKRRELALYWRQRRTQNVNGIEEVPDSIQLFNKMTNRLETPATILAVTILNVSARIGLSLTFVGFVVDLVRALNINGYPCPLEFNDVLALSILWSSLIAINEGRTRQKPLLHSLSYLQAKYRIGAPTEELAHANCLTRVAATFFYSKAQFSPVRLRKALRQMENATEVEMESLVRRTI